MAQAYVGTSGFDYPEWKPAFYPADLQRKKFLQYYSTSFLTVELNNTFYQMPNPLGSERSHGKKRTENREKFFSVIAMGGTLSACAFSRCE